MKKYYSQLITFYYIVEFMSFTKAAKHLHCSKAYISNQLTNLEQKVGSILLYRNTRSLQLTFAGETLFTHAQSLVKELELSEKTIQSLQSNTEGTLTITSPSGYADYLLAPHLPAFLNQYPDIKLEMKHCGNFLDLVKEKIDIAIRITHEPPLDRVAKLLGYDRLVICASKKYLKTHGRPTTPAQLTKHRCLVYSPQKNVNHWPFIERNKEIIVTVKPNVLSNSTQVLINAILNGAGIGRLPQFVVKDYIKRDLLEILLSDYAPTDIPIYAIFSHSRIIPPKIQAFIKFLEKIHCSSK